MTTVDDATRRWVFDNDDSRSVAASIARVAESEYGEAFDETKYVLQGDVVEEKPLDVVVLRDVERALGSVARAVQRSTVCEFHSSYVRGRMLDIPSYAKKVSRPQKFFRVESFMELSSVEDTSLVSALMQGVVRTRLGAQTGVGKTRRLPGILAAKCGLRVCQLELDVSVAKSAMEFQKKEYGIPGSVKSWCRERKAFIAVMSYDEFRGIVLSGNRDRLFEDFDLFYMDEAHEPLATVWCAMQYFAHFCQSHNSLVIASATVSTVESNNTSTIAAGTFKVEPEPLSLRGAIDSGRLTGEHLRDRTMLLVASGEDAALARAYYEECGVDVHVLDTASTDADKSAVVAAFSVSTSVVPRVLVAVEKYGTGYNIPLSYVISTCTRRVYEITADNSLEEREVPLMSKSITQHKGRVGRGLAVGGGGWLLRGDVSADKQLLPSEALSAYLSLVAAGITPRPGLFDAVTKVLPRGIDADVARMVLRVGLPPALTVRYLGSDGRFARKFAAAVRLFTQSGEYMSTSKDEVPLGYSSWVTEEVGGYYEGDDSRTSVVLTVPFRTCPGLRVAMHAISAVAEGFLSLDYWDWYDEEEESDDEATGVRTLVRRRAVPRLPEAPVRVFADSSVGTSKPVWSYDVSPEQAVKRKKRQAMSWTANGEGHAAVTTLLRSVEDGSLGRSVARPEVGVPEHGDKVAYSLPLEDDGVVAVKSAGGGKIMLVSRVVHDAFMSGESLHVASAKEVVEYMAGGGLVERFAKSTVFDNWSPAWLCWFRTFANVTIVDSWKSVGLHSQAICLLNCLYDRFRSEVFSVATSSNLYKDKLSSFFRSKPSVSKFVSAVRVGKLPVAQSAAYVSRVIEIKDAYDVAVMAIEEAGIFAPKLVTKAQGKLPIRDPNRRMSVIDRSVVDNPDWKPHKKSSSVDWRR